MKPYSFVIEDNNGRDFLFTERHDLYLLLFKELNLEVDYVYHDLGTVMKMTGGKVNPALLAICLLMVISL